MMDTTKNKFRISILISTKNRKNQLFQFIQNISTLPESPKWELIIVDNGSTDGTLSALQKLNTNIQLKILHEPLPGKSRALNLAISHAQGDLLVFTDDDVKPESLWLKSLYDAACSTPDVNIFGGCVNVDHQLLPKWIRNSYNLSGVLASEHYINDVNTRYDFRKYPIGPNMAVRSSAISHLKSPWQEWLGPGTKFPLGDERAFMEQISPVEKNDRLYVAESVVWHTPEAEQLHFLHALKRCYQSGLVGGRLDQLHKSKHQESTIKTRNLVIQRLYTCRSFRELCCILARATGVLIGRQIKHPESHTNENS